MKTRSVLSFVFLTTMIFLASCTKQKISDDNDPNTFCNELAQVNTNLFAPD